MGVPPEQSDLLRWWHDNFQRFNHYPLAVADFGMSNQDRRFASTVSSIISLEDMDCGSVTGWFRKPFAISCSPFSKTIWLDVDVEIRGDLGILFPYCTDSRIGVGEDTFLNSRACKNGLFRKRLPPEAILYDTGLLVVEEDSSILASWREATRQASPGEFDGDNEILSLLLHRNPALVCSIPKALHCMRCEGDRSGTLVMHWTGARGKAAIRERMQESQRERANRIE